MSLNRDTSQRRKTFNRRTILLAGAGAGVFVGLGARLWQLQVVDAEEYATLSTDNQFNHRPVPPSRGRIVDRFGIVVADNDVTWQLRVVPEQLRDQDAVLATLARMIDPPDRDGPTGAARRAARMERWKRAIARSGRRFDEVTLEAALGWPAFARINLNRPDLPGVIAEAGETRAYGIRAGGASDTGPRDDSDAFAHVIGYVAKPTEDWIEESLDEARDAQERSALSRVLRHPGYRAGRAGIELTLDEALQGEWGELRVEVDAFGRAIRELGLDQETSPGEDVRLTLDAELQSFTQRRLDGESAAVAGIDVRTGEIRCLVSAPAFDPNRFARGIETPAYRALVADPRKPLFNKPLAGLYPPGSTFKMLTVLAALRWNVIDPEQKVFCNGKMRVGDRDFHCWKREGHGLVDMHDGVKKSCDVYFYEIARTFEVMARNGEIPFERGIDAIADEARRFGLGDAYDIAAPGGRDGTVPTAAWKRARIGEAWATGETLVCAIGQGFLTASPLQLAVMTARLATGRAVTPSILTSDGPARSFDDLPPLAEEAHLDTVRRGMFGAVEEVGGTAYWSLGAKGIDIPGMTMGGKTGTSQVRRITEEERAAGVIKNEDLPWRRRDHALFVAYAPFDDPKYAVALVIEHGGSGSRAAAPPARDILREMMLRDIARSTADAGGGRG